MYLIIFLPLHSGYTFRTASIVQEQQRRNWRISLLTGTKHATGEELLTIERDLTVYRTPERHKLMAQIPVLDQYAVIRNLRRRVGEVVDFDAPDVIHAHSPCLNGLAALRTARRRNIPFVYEMRASWEDAAVSHGTTQESSFKYKLARMLESHVLRHADHVVTICDGLKTEIETRGVLGRQDHRRTQRCITIEIRI